MMIQLHTPLWCQTPLGEGMIQFAIDYNINNNLIFLVELNETRQYKCFDSNDIFGVENPTYGLKRKENVKASYE